MKTFKQVVREAILREGGDLESFRREALGHVKKNAGWMAKEAEKVLG